MKSSSELLNEYHETGSELAFRELVERYIGLVYSAALRLLDGDTHLAEDVAQSVFIDLSQKAGSLGKDVALGGWLHRRTFNIAAPLLRSNRRRQAREKAAMENDTMQNCPSDELAHLAPVLDEAINALPTEERTTVVMRFFEQQSFRSIGVALGISDDAAQKRVTRALERLHVLLRQRGVTLAVPAVAAALAADSLTAAPAGLAASITGGVLGGSISSGVVTSDLIKAIAMTKLKAGLVGVVLLGGGAAILVQMNSTNQRLRMEVKQLRAQQHVATQPAGPNAEGSSSTINRASEKQPSDAELLRLRLGVSHNY